MKISIITVVLNNRAFIEDCIHSVISQSYRNIEYIIIDGGSTDGTIGIIRKYEKYISKWVSEPDSGIYDAMNKGINMATGDIIGILNSDDFYYNSDVISSVVKEFETKKVDSVFADLVYVKRNNPATIVRYYNSAHFNPDKFAFGWMPAHPAFFVKSFIYEKYGLFRTDYKIAADYELLTRFLGKYRISYSYIPEVFVKMRTKGVSTRNIKSNFILNKEIVRACSDNGIKTNYFKVYSKYFIKIFQLLGRPQAKLNWK